MTVPIITFFNNKGGVGTTSLVYHLACSCWRCNRYKGSDLGSFYPQTGQFSFLFHPRTQSWTEHFRVEDHRLIGLTPFGRTTVALLQLNSEERIIERRRIHEANSGSNFT